MHYPSQGKVGLKARARWGEPKIAKKEERGLTTRLLPFFPPFFLSLAKGKWRQIGGFFAPFSFPQGQDPSSLSFSLPPFRAIKLSGSRIRQSVPFMCALYRHHYMPDGDFPSNFSSLLYTCMCVYKSCSFVSDRVLVSTCCFLTLDSLSWLSIVLVGKGGARAASNSSWLR